MSAPQNNSCLGHEPVQRTDSSEAVTGKRRSYDRCLFNWNGCYTQNMINITLNLSAKGTFHCQTCTSLLLIYDYMRLHQVGKWHGKKHLGGRITWTHLVPTYSFREGFSWQEFVMLLSCIFCMLLLWRFFFFFLTLFDLSLKKVKVN